MVSLSWLFGKPIVLQTNEVAESVSANVFLTQTKKSSFSHFFCWLFVFL